MKIRIIRTRSKNKKTNVLYIDGKFRAATGRCKAKDMRSAS